MPWIRGAEARVGEVSQHLTTLSHERKGCLMSLYIKTEDYSKHGISKYSDLAVIRAVVQKELNIDRVFVSFVNKHEYIRVDFLKPRPPRRSKRHAAYKKASKSSQQA
jgi:hypothetical protein